ncbi:MAG: hypothetical protein JWM82_1658, partial [Myxococcales bacterium]|nr:hypothetical protein [Myxococcales bacterium]
MATTRVYQSLMYWKTAMPGLRLEFGSLEQLALEARKETLAHGVVIR